MDAQARAAFIIAQAACATAEIAAMQAHNDQAVASGKIPQFGHDEFMSIPDRYGISHNAVIAYLTGA